MDFTLDENTHAQAMKLRHFIKNELQPLEDDVEAKGVLGSNTATEIFEKIPKPGLLWNEYPS